MPNLLTTTCVMACPHGGTVKVVTDNKQTRAAGDFVLRATDTFAIAGCTLTSPCVQVNWSVTATRSTVGGDAVLNDASVGECINAGKAAQGFVVVVPAQFRVTGI